MSRYIEKTTFFKRDSDMTRLLITHNDLDGIGSAVLAVHGQLGFDAIYVWQYGVYDRRVIDAYDEVIVADLSFPPEQVTDNMTILDHHESSKWLVEDPYSRHKHDEKSCGTELFYKYYYKFEHTPVVDRFVELIRIYDTWQSDHRLFDLACDLNRCFQGMLEPKMDRNDVQVVKDGKLTKNAFTHFINSMFYTVFKLGLKSFAFNGPQKSAIEQVKKDENNAYAQSIKTYKKYGNIGVVEVRGPFATYVGNRLLNEHKDITIAALTYPKFDHVSLRSRSDFDLTSIKGYKGHKHAGSISKKTLEELISK